MVEELFHVAAKLEELCRKCKFCEAGISCPGAEKCTGCESCVVACPFEAKILVPENRKRGQIRIKVDGETLFVPEQVTVLKALECLDYRFSKFPEKDAIFAPCRTGGCWSCAVNINGQLKPACITPIKEDMNITTINLEMFTPLRLITGFSGHPVGGVDVGCFMTVMMNTD